MTHVVSCILPCNVKQSTGKVPVSHLKTVVESPERGAERVRDTVEPATRRSVCLEHQERLPGLLSNGSVREIILDDVDTRRVR